MGRARRITLTLAAAAMGLGVGVCAGGAMLVNANVYDPGEAEWIPVVCADDTPEMPRARPVKVLAWNVQFSAGRTQRFFYDGGDAVSVPLDRVDNTIDGLIETVKRHDPDIVLWQEIDRDSARTGRVDQYKRLLEALPYPCHASTPYHRALYVPTPPHEHLGRVDMHLAVFSRYRIDQATRFQLPLLQESWVRQIFNLRRALMALRFPVEGGGSFMAYNTHLSAFSRGDGTLERQVAMIRAHLDEAGRANTPWLLAGDLNSLPPGDDPSRLGEDGVLYTDAAPPIQPLFDSYTPAVPLNELLSNPQPWRTYVPFGADRTDRVIDYMFYGQGVVPHTYSVDSNAIELSDHIPLISEFSLR
jgi:endonuclease/exonuclease/phosphatase family metal-dependent hydrolase